MVFKPWHAIGKSQPRHLISDVPTSLKSNPLPIVKVELQEKVAGTLLILPSTLKAIFEGLVRQVDNDSKVVGTINIWSVCVPEFGVDDEFVEEEQLYRIREDDDSVVRALSTKLEIWKVMDNLTVVVMDNYREEQVINYNLIAAELLKIVDQNVAVVSLTPGSLPFGATVRQLCKSNDSVLSFDPLIPPFFITGISASILSQEKLINSESPKTTVLVLQSEGVPGFEKINIEAVREVGFWLMSKFSLKKQFVEDVEKLIAVGKSVNNFALYL